MRNGGALAHEVTVVSHVTSVEEPLPCIGPETPGLTALSLRGIFEENASYVWRTLRYLGVRDEDLEDMSQEVFLVLHRKLPEFEGRSSIRTWLYAVCVRTVSDQSRRARVRREIITDEPPAGSVCSPQHTEFEQQQTRELLRSLLDELDADKRAVFVLHEIEELPMQEVARSVGCPLKTAYSRLYAARRSLEEALMRRGRP